MEEKKRLLKIIVLNSTLKEGIITPELRKPFGMLRDMNLAGELKKAPDLVDSGALKKWRVIVDYFKTSVENLVQEMSGQIEGVLAA